MEKIIVLPIDDPILDYFPPLPDLKFNIPYLPADVIMSGSWRSDTTSVYRKLVPAFTFFQDGKILAVKDGTQYRLWFGDAITQDDLYQYPDCESLMRRTLKKERIRSDISYDFIGYCTYKQARVRNEFLILYAAILEKKQLLKQEEWIDVPSIMKFYFNLEPLSRKIYDVFYETSLLQKKYLSV